MNEPNDQHRDELRDRLLDQALRETLDAESPPDLTDRILAAAEQQTSELPQPKGEGVMGKSKKEFRFYAASVLAVCSVAVVFGGLLVSSQISARRTVMQDNVMYELAPPSAASSGYGGYGDEGYGGVDALEFDSGLGAESGRYEDHGGEPVIDWYDLTDDPASSSARPGYVTQGNQARSLALSPDGKTLAPVQVDVGGQTLPSPFYMADDVQYFPTDEEFRLSREVARMRKEMLAAERDQVSVNYATESNAREAIGKVQAAHESLSQLRGEVEGLRADILSSLATRDTALKSLAEKTDTAYAVGLSKADLQKQAELVAEQLAAANEVLRKIKLESGQGPGQGGDQYVRLIENPFQAVKDHPLSTFSIDVDTASYANVRRFLMQENRLPPPDAVRIEELVNYFDFDYSGPTSDVPFASHIEVAACPWAPEHRLVRVALKGHEIQTNQRPASNLVFLLDVSGSMSSADKLPLLQAGMKLLAGQLSENDRVAIVVYAGSEGLVLPSTVGDQRAKVLDAIDRLKSGGSTNGGAGIELAYKVAQEHFIEGGVNRVILCTDGDFNVGTTSTGALERIVEEKARSGVFLSVLGFGRGNLNDAMMETISNKGNGNYAYIDGITEAQKVLVEQMGGTLIAIAKDVKIQVEFNPMQVAAYRLIGYENRMLAAEDFNDDKKDAGEIGAGHTVTALYELVPAGGKVELPDVDPLKYQVAPKRNKNKEVAGEMLTLKLRYKQPDGDTSELLEFPVSDGDASFSESSPDLQFAAAVASFGMLLRGSQYRGMSSYDAVLEIAESAKGDDKHGYRAEFVQIVEQAKPLGEERMARLEEVRKLLEAAKESADRDEPKPLSGLQGIVLAATPDNVEISLGSDDGVLVGHQLDVFRTADGGSTYLGKIKVIQTMPDKSVCKILPQFRKGEIKASDRVSAGLQE